MGLMYIQRNIYKYDYSYSLIPFNSLEEWALDIYNVKLFDYLLNIFEYKLGTNDKMCRTTIYPSHHLHKSLERLYKELEKNND